MDFVAFCIVQNSDLQIMQVTVANLFVCTLLYYTPVSEDLSNEPNFSGVFLFFIIWLLRKPSLWWNVILLTYFILYLCDANWLNIICFLCLGVGAGGEEQEVVALSIFHIPGLAFVVFILFVGTLSYKSTYFIVKLPLSIDEIYLAFISLASWQDVCITLFWYSNKFVRKYLKSMWKKT